MRVGGRQARAPPAQPRRASSGRIRDTSRSDGYQPQSWRPSQCAHRGWHHHRVSLHRPGNPRAARHRSVARLHPHSSHPPVAHLGPMANTSRRPDRRGGDSIDRCLERDHRFADHSASRGLAEVRGQHSHQSPRIERRPTDLGCSRSGVRHACGTCRRRSQSSKVLRNLFRSHCRWKCGNRSQEGWRRLQTWCGLCCRR